MYRKRRVGTRKSIPTKKVAVRKAVRKQSNKKIAKVVKNVISKQVETKVVQLGGDLTPRCIQSGTTQTQFDATCAMVTPQVS